MEDRLIEGFAENVYTLLIALTPNSSSGSHNTNNYTGDEA